MRETNYGFTTVVPFTFEEALEKVKEELSKNGFGVVTELDISTTLKEKLNVDHRPYRILGACHPQSAYQAIEAEEEIGLFLPCNVIVYIREDAKIAVAAINPGSAMMSVNNENLRKVAIDITERLKNVISRL
jgi:uncharacterized protein (DUF302 family)